MRLLSFAVVVSAPLLVLAQSPRAVADAGAWPSLTAPAKLGGGEKDAALIAAVERYAFVAPVPGARENGVDWYNHLVGGRGTPADAVRLLKDEAVTKEKLLKYAREAAAAVKPGGTLWMLFVGHGAPSKDGKDALLVGADAQQDADSLFERSVRRSELLQIAEQSAAARVVVILDACFSGRTSSGQPLAKGLQPLVVTGPPPRIPPKVVVLTAAKQDELAGPLPFAARPALSYLALGALRGWADAKEAGGDGDGHVSARELHGYAKRALASAVTDRTQTPTLEGDGALDLGPGAERGPDIPKLIAAAAIREQGGGGGVVVARKSAFAAHVGPSILKVYGETRTLFGLGFELERRVSQHLYFGFDFAGGFGSGLLSGDIGPQLKWKWALGSTGRHQPYVRAAIPFRYFLVKTTDQFTGEQTDNNVMAVGAILFGFGYKFFVTPRVGIGIDFTFIPTIVIQPTMDFIFTFNLGFGVEIRI